MRNTVKENFEFLNGMLLISASYFLNAIFVAAAIRFLSFEEYSIFALINYIFSVIGISFYSFQNLGLTSNSSNAEKAGEKRILIGSYLRTFYLTIAALALIVILMVNAINIEINLSYYTLLVFAPAMFVMSIYLGIAISQGKMHLILRIGLFGACLKVIVLAASEVFEYEVWILLLSLALIPYFTNYLLKQKLSSFKVLRIHSDVKNTLGMSLIGIVFWIGTSLDVFLIRLVLNEEQSGIYMVTATLGRTILFIYLYLVQREYPKMRSNVGKQSITHLYLKGFYCLVPSSLLFYFFGDIISQSIFGKSFETFQGFTTLYLLSLLPLVYVLPQLQYLVIKHDFRIIPIFVIILIISAFSLVVFSKATSDVLGISFLTNLLFAFVLHFQRVIKAKSRGIKQ